MSALRPMTEAEYTHFMSYMWEDYAQERARNFRTPVADERADAERQRTQLLQDGLNTPGHHFWTVVDDSGAVVGSPWVFIDEPNKRAFIYDIDAAQRGKGYGRRTRAAQSEPAAIGCDTHRPERVRRQRRRPGPLSEGRLLHSRHLHAEGDLAPRSCLTHRVRPCARIACA